MTGLGAHLSGAAAEEIALRDYLAEGARLLARRWRCADGEIDLVVQAGDTVVFVEVKARRHRAAAAASLSPAQIRRLGAAATRWLAEAGAPGAACRFDVVLVDRSGRAERLENALDFNGWW